MVNRTNRAGGSGRHSPPAAFGFLRTAFRPRTHRANGKKPRFTSLQFINDEKRLLGERLAAFIVFPVISFPGELLDQKTWVSKPSPDENPVESPSDSSGSRNTNCSKPRELSETPSYHWKIQRAAYYAAKARQCRPSRIRIKLVCYFQRERNATAPLTTLVQISRSGRYHIWEMIMQVSGYPGRRREIPWLSRWTIPVALAERKDIPDLHRTFSIRLRAAHFLNDRRFQGKVILKDLPRPTYTEFADLNEDGKTDFVLSMFGNVLGGLSWFENKGDDQYQEHVVIAKAGAIRTVVQDFNGDKHLDIAFLLTQELECFYILLNDGHGEFSGNVIFQRPPLYGHTYFEMADFNRDGLPDILVTNGDNGEYPSPLKKYHGIRIYLNKGNWRFEEAFFYPLNGAFKAVARDFDEDGDLDIAAISYFPDYADNPKESFVYLENLGGLHFAASTFGDCISGRWLIMECGDLDGDGDWDIVLGSYGDRRMFRLF